MRYIFAALVALSTIPSSSWAQPVESESGVAVEEGRRYQGRSSASAQCRELRRACLYKEELGEVGMGNCRRYRELCR